MKKVQKLLEITVHTIEYVCAGTVQIHNRIHSVNIVNIMNILKKVTSGEFRQRQKIILFPISLKTLKYLKFQLYFRSYFLKEINSLH